MSFTDLSQAVQNFASSLSNVFSNSSATKPYPTSDPNKVLNNFDLINNYKTANWNTVIQKCYAFNVFDINTGNAINPGSSTFAGFSEIALQINPLDMTQEEEFAINITPTINGVISEHNGIIFRDLTISGTTGNFPGKGAGGSTAAGKAIGNSPSNLTGYEHFQQLRNYFRAYAQYKKSFLQTNPQSTVNPCLIFINRKDIEYLIVEPIRFVMRRQGNRGFLYDYNIQLKVIGNFTKIAADPANTGFAAILGSVDSAISAINDTLATATGLLLAGSALLTQIEAEVQNAILEPLRQVGLMVKTIQGIGLQINDMGASLISSLNNTQVLQMLGIVQSTSATTGVTAPSNIQVAAAAGPSALLALGAANLNSIPLDTSILSNAQNTALNTQIANALQLPRSFFSDLAVTAGIVADNAADAFGVGSTGYNQYAQRNATFVAPPGTVPTKAQADILYGFSLMIYALNNMLAFTGTLQPNNSQARIDAIESNFDNAINIPIPPSVFEVMIPTNYTLEDLAFQYLGDYGRWIELVELNNLIPPYITPVGGSFAFFAGTIVGTLTPVIVTADNPGTPGDSISLVFNGYYTISSAITNWNNANPTNTVSLTSGNGAQIPTTQVLLLSDGIDDPRVLVYGDNIIMPGTAATSAQNTRVVAENNYTANLSETEKRMGIDIMLGAGFDFMFGNNQDVQLIVGGNNANQAINIKIRLDKGDLRYHPEIGLGLNIGDKITTIDTVYDNVVQTILSDPRFQSIDGFTMSVDGDEVFLTVQVAVAQSATPVPINIAM